MEIARGMLVTQFTLFFVLSSNAVHSSMHALLSCYSSFTTQTVKHQHTLIKRVFRTVVGRNPFPKSKTLIIYPSHKPTVPLQNPPLSVLTVISSFQRVLIVAEYRRQTNNMINSLIYSALHYIFWLRTIKLHWYARNVYIKDKAATCAVDIEYIVSYCL